MPLLRLIGLALFITAIFLALAAAITKTTHIRFQDLASSAADPQAPPGAPAIEPLPIETIQLPAPLESTARVGSTSTISSSLQFTAVPIIWPLFIAAGSGLLLWFSHPLELSRVPTAKRKNRRRR